ncbi:MAG: type I methionyl aminopeptidase [Elusimicrobiaceae bacterium]|jgi:methionyl aminopeptidase|nr:type I methionyl aminopeptidase [Elusimicrobiaceae bacterium]MBT3955250.1 type I methionyl aminopeptidase [Elusimicrobiaceae bacterium]MBT4007764.1 type I methionyl aminopeptidase [Elusimicrobiaceae bacterium]MBT4402410.1 type I methionyl aminopeptidase [Elusimicrobiaceae bacterium]MBT4440405.1 type I methionyl aminopeptidase [Elusimicrobiaceae bacterium]
MIVIKTEAEIERMKVAGKVVAQVLEILREAIKPGVSTKQLDTIAYNKIKELGAEPAFLNYHGFPASICASINEELVHGIPSEQRILKQGDIISIDTGAKIGGFYGDAAITVAVGKISHEAQRLMDVTKQCLKLAIKEAKPGNYLGDIGYAVQKHAEANGMSVVRDFVGHGIGRALHEEPQIPNFGNKGTGVLLEEGMVFALEPMVNLGNFDVKVSDDNWKVVSKDGKINAHFEHTIAITKNGAKILTEL